MKSEALYLFIERKTASYQIMASGELWRFNADMREPEKTVYVAADEIRQLVEGAGDKSSVWQRCNALYRKAVRRRANTEVSLNEQSELAVLLGKASVLK